MKEYRNTTSHEEYRAVISYLRLKLPMLTRGKDKIQWRYAMPKKTVEVVDRITQIKQSMSATICYENKEPIGFSGVYYKEHKDYGIIQNGLVMYVDDNFRRQGIASTFYTLQEEKMRRVGVRYCYEIQIGGNIPLSFKFGYKQLTEGRIKTDGTPTQIRFLIDSHSEASKQRMSSFLEKNIPWIDGLCFEFLAAQKFTIEQLNEPWRIE